MNCHYRLMISLVSFMSERVVVICTGQPGSGRDEYLDDIATKRQFHYYHIFDYLVEEAEKGGYVLNKQNVLDFYDSNPERLESFRVAALKRIVAEIGETSGVHIISTPYHFEWKGKSYKGLTEEEVQTLNPDLFILVLDDLLRVRERLREDVQWKDHNFTLVELAQWRREEMRGVYNLSRRSIPHKGFYLVAREHGVGLLEDLIFRRKKTIYLSHPITGESESFFRDIRRFASKLQSKYAVFDPSMIQDWEIVETWRRMRNESMGERTLPRVISFSVERPDGTKEYELESWDIESAIKNIRAQIIDMDYRIIESCDYTVAYHPREQVSAGVMCEMVEAKSLAKLVYAYYPYEPSPFFEWYATKLFQDENQLLEFLMSLA